MEKGNKARQIVDQMMENDHFSQWLGIEVLEITEGSCKLGMTVRKEMLNGFGIAHGGITYSLADSSLAFASNSHGKKSVSISTSIEHLKPVKEGDKLLSTVHEIQVTSGTGQYRIDIHNQESSLVASFRGTVYRRKEEW